MTMKQVTFTEEDRQHLEDLFCLADTFAELIGPHCEVVIHSFESLDHSVVKIVNGHHTGRTVGSPITDLGLKMCSELERNGSVSPKSYFTQTIDGKSLKSITCIISRNNKAIGMFCINLNLSSPLAEIIKTLIPDISNMKISMNEKFSAHSEDVIQEALENAKIEIEHDESIHMKGRNKAIIRQLYDNGIFELKDTTNQVSQQLGITRQAIYKYIREFKSN